MLKTFKLAAPIAWLVVLTACDNGASKTPAEAAKPAPAVAATPASAAAPVTSVAVLAALNADDVCDTFAMAVSSKKTKVSGKGCTAVAGDDGVTITSADGAATLLAPLVVAGKTVQVTATNASAAAVEKKALGGFTNVGMVFVGKASSGDLCMKAQYLAPDGSSNSLFVWRPGDADRTTFDLSKHPTDVLESFFAEPVIAAGKSGVLTLHRREPGVVLKSISFLDCSQVPAPKPK